MDDSSLSEVCFDQEKIVQTNKILENIENKLNTFFSKKSNNNNSNAMSNTQLHTILKDKTNIQEALKNSEKKSAFKEQYPSSQKKSNDKFGDEIQQLKSKLNNFEQFMKEDEKRISNKLQEQNFVKSDSCNDLYKENKPFQSNQTEKRSAVASIQLQREGKRSYDEVTTLKCEIRSLRDELKGQKQQLTKEFEDRIQEQSKFQAMQFEKNLEEIKQKNKEIIEEKNKLIDNYSSQIAQFMKEKQMLLKQIETLLQNVGTNIQRQQSVNSFQSLTNLQSSKIQQISRIINDNDGDKSDDDLQDEFNYMKSIGKTSNSNKRQSSCNRNKQTNDQPQQNALIKKSRISSSTTCIKKDDNVKHQASKKASNGVNKKIKSQQTKRSLNQSRSSDIDSNNQKGKMQNKKSSQIPEAEKPKQKKANKILVSQKQLKGQMSERPKSCFNNKSSLKI